MLAHVALCADPPDTAAKPEAAQTAQTAQSKEAEAAKATGAAVGAAAEAAAEAADEAAAAGDGAIVDTTNAPVWRAMRKAEAAELSRELALARLAWAMAAVDLRDDAGAISAASSLLAALSAQLGARGGGAQHGAVWHAVQPRVQSSHVASLLHQFHR